MGMWTPGPGPTSGDDIFDGDDSDEIADGGEGNDILVGNAGSDTLIGGAGNDRFSAGGNAVGDVDLFIGGDGDDVCISLGAASTFDGGDGVDMLTGSRNIGFTINVEILQSEGGVLTGLAEQFEAFDTIRHISGAAVQLLLRAPGDLNLRDELLNQRTEITGSSGDDAIISSNRNDLLYGMAGDDFIDGGFGDDLIDGGGGVDTVDYSWAPGAIVIANASSGYRVTGAAGEDQLRNMEVFIGSDFNDKIGVRGVAYGGGGNDTLVGSFSKDTLDGGAGADTMSGYLGDDVYYVNDPADVIVETAGISITARGGVDDVFSSVTYSLPNWVENLTLTGSDALKGVGNSFANKITGNDAANILDGKAGTDTLTGGNGDDLYVVDHYYDVVVETAPGGVDTVLTFHSRVLDANVEKLTLGGAGDINGGGNSLDNAIKGNSGVNILSGGAGDDLIAGYEGRDRLTGGEGRDGFIFNTAPSEEERDRITDFSVADDTIRLDNAVFTSLGANGVLNPDFFHVGAVAADADDCIIYDNGSLFYDPDGTGAAAQVRIAYLEGAPALTFADILVV